MRRDGMRPKARCFVQHLQLALQIGQLAGQGVVHATARCHIALLHATALDTGDQGMLAIEYALKHQQHLKGLVVSNMMSSIRPSTMAR